MWDEEKNKKLIKKRSISFEEVAQIILDGGYKDILENPARKNQYIFIITLKGYTHVVPFIIDDNSTIILKTVFPSRKFHKKYGGK